MLSRIQKIVGFDIKFLIKAGSLVTSSSLINTIFGLLFSVLLAALASKQLIGEYRYILAISSMFAAFTYTGFNTAVTRSFAIDQTGILWQLLIRRLKLCIPIIVITVLAGAYYGLQANYVLMVSFFIISFTNPLIESFKMSLHYLLGREKYRALSVVSVATQSLPLLLLIPTLYVTDNSLPLIIVYFLSHTLIDGLIFWYAYSQDKLSNEPSALPENNELDDSVKYGKKMSYIEMLAGAIQPLDQILVFQTIGSADLANYSYATQLPGKMKGLLRQSASIALPRFSRRNYEVLRKTLPKKILLKFSIITIFVLVYILVAEKIFETFFPEFVSVVAFSQIASLTMYASITPDIGSAFRALKASNVIMFLTITSAVIKIALLVIGSIFYGIFGILIAMLLSQFFQFLLYCLCFFNQSIYYHFSEQSQ